MPGYYQADRDIAQALLPDHGQKFTESEAFTYLSSYAAFAPRLANVRGKLIALGLGELVASERYLESRWSWSRGRVRTFKTKLTKQGVLDQREDQKETILIILFIRGYENSEVVNDTTKETIASPPKAHPKPNLITKNKKRKNNTTVDAPAPAWSSTDGWSGISEKDLADWREAYPACDITRQLASMNQWLLSNPSKARKKQWRRFITNWMNRTQERGGDMASAISNKESGSPTTGEIKIGGRTGFIHSAAELKLDDDDE